MDISTRRRVRALQIGMGPSPSPLEAERSTGEKFGGRWSMFATSGQTLHELRQPVRYDDQLKIATLDSRCSIDERARRVPWEFRSSERQTPQSRTASTPPCRNRCRYP